MSSHERILEEDEAVDRSISSTHDTGYCSLEASRQRYGALLQDCSIMSACVFFLCGSSRDKLEDVCAQPS